jgi:pilin isopeptide linkage protein
MGKNANRKRMIAKAGRWPLRLRVLALMLALTMLLTSSGMQVLAEEPQTETVTTEETKETRDSSAGTQENAKKDSSTSTETTEQTETAVTEATKQTEAPKTTPATEGTGTESENSSDAAAGSDSNTEEQDFTENNTTDSDSTSNKETEANSTGDAAETTSDPVTFTISDQESEEETETVVSSSSQARRSKLELSKTYAYTKDNLVEYTITVNSAGKDLLQNASTITLVDEMGSGMRLATEAEKANRLTVTSNGTDITSQCVLYDNTNVEDDSQEESGEGTVENPKPHTFTLTIPDNVPVTIKYYVVVDGLVGDEVELKNSVYYYGFSEDEGSTQDETVTLLSWGSSSVSPSFYINKVDESGNPLTGVEFTLYQVELASDGTPVTDSATGLPKLIYVDSKTTDTTGTVRFEDVDDDLLYCYMETGSLAGYMANTERYYLQFTHHAAAEAVISNIKGTMHDATLVVKNYKGTSYQIPVAKTINYSSTSDCTLPFSFMLKKKTGDSYTSDAYTNAFSEETVSITGTGSTTFSTLYFNAAGTYVYTITENDTDATAIYTKDTDICEVTIVVGTDHSGALCVESATFRKGEKTYDLTKRTPTFNNSYNTPGSVTLAATKKVTGGRTKDIEEGEFTFQVVDTEYDEIVATGKTMEGSSTSAPIEFTPVSGARTDGATLSYNQDDIGKTYVYEISEVVPKEGDEGYDASIGYTTDKITVTVTVTDQNNGTLETTVTYTDANGKETTDPTFTNTYSASGSVTLHGTKKLTGYRSAAITEGEFTFRVKEIVNGEETTEVATGKTLAGTGNTATIEFTPTSGDNNDWYLQVNISVRPWIVRNQNITLDQTAVGTASTASTASIGTDPAAASVDDLEEDSDTPENEATFSYTEADIGKTYTYVISEDTGTDPMIDYTTDKVTVTVTVGDNGDGTLSTDVKYRNSAGEENTTGAEFVNEYLIPVPTGIRVDILSYAIIIAFTACLSMLLTRYRRKRRI